MRVKPQTGTTIETPNHLSLILNGTQPCIARTHTHKNFTIHHNFKMT